MIQHVVLLRFADASHAPEAKERLEVLARQVPQIRTLSAGLDVVGSEVSWHLALVTTHDDLDALRGYQQHPAHEAFGAWLRPLLTDRAAVDSEIGAG